MKRVLIIAGSDSGGGAGIQADIKTASALGAYAATAITALTAQNTMKVERVEAVSPDMVVAQIRAVLSDIGADAIKIGMLHSEPIIRAVVRTLEEVSTSLPIVLDPVMVSTSGDVLLDADAIEVMTEQLFPIAALITPNLPEALKLTGTPVTDPHESAEMLLSMGPSAVLLKGGHGPGDHIADVLATPEETHVFEDVKIDTVHTHGTGCTLATAIAVHLAEGLDLKDAVGRARGYLRRAIETAPGFGAGHGPINHLHPITERES